MTSAAAPRAAGGGALPADVCDAAMVAEPGAGNSTGCSATAGRGAATEGAGLVARDAGAGCVPVRSGNTSMVVTAARGAGRDPAADVAAGALAIAGNAPSIDRTVGRGVTAAAAAGAAGGGAEPTAGNA